MFQPIHSHQAVTGEHRLVAAGPATKSKTLSNTKIYIIEKFYNLAKILRNEICVLRVL